jgi:hypothetical protein
MWCAWVEENGAAIGLDKRVFGRELGALGLDIETKVKKVDGRVKRGWMGMRVKTWDEE